MPKTFEEFNNKLTALFTLNCPTSFFDIYNLYGDCLNDKKDSLVYGRIYGSTEGNKEETIAIKQVVPLTPLDLLIDYSSIQKHQIKLLRESKAGRVSFKDKNKLEDLIKSFEVNDKVKTQTIYITKPAQISFDPEPKEISSESIILNQKYFAFNGLSASYFEIANTHLVKNNTIIFSFKLSNLVAGKDICLCTFTTGNNRIIFTVDNNIFGGEFVLSHSSGTTKQYTSVLTGSKNIFDSNWHNIIISLYNNETDFVKAKVWLDGNLINWKFNSGAGQVSTCSLLKQDLTNSIIRFGDDRYYVSKGQISLISANGIKGIRIYSDKIDEEDKDLIKIFSANNETIIKQDGTLFTKSIAEHIPPEESGIVETPEHGLDVRYPGSDISSICFWEINELGDEESGEYIEDNDQLILYNDIAKIRRIGEY